MVNIFDFTDFRDYLRAFFEDKKRTNRRYSYQALAQKAGFNNRGFVYNIIKGNKKLSKDNIFKLTGALGLNKKETAYFENLVDFAQAKNEQVRTHYLEQIELNRNIPQTATQLMGQNKLEFYMKWYHSAIRALIGIIAVSDNYEELSRLIYPPITVQQAKNSVELLKRLGLIEKGDDGIFHITNKTIKASDEISQLALKRFHIECTELAKQSLINSNPKLHFKSSVTLGISEEAFEAIHEESLKFRARIAELAGSYKKADRVYQYQFNFFPVSTVDTSDYKGDDQ